MPCPCCGAEESTGGPVLWRELIAEWQLAPHEVAYIDRQQGQCCSGCGANLRSRALAAAIMGCYGFPGTFGEFVTSEPARRLRVLEVNEACILARWLAELPGRVLATFPEVDMMALPYPDGAFDLVVHSDSLEHIPRPIRGLAECRRVLKPGGFCAFTVPIIVDRLTLAREGRPPSYHGTGDNAADFLVHTEYGADAWTHVALAGFRECRILPFEYPAAQALVGVR